jgi:purine nucleosidase
LLRYLKSGVCRILICVFCFSFLCASAATPRRVPIVLDTDIGSDIDDAFALAMVIQSRELDLKAVTTVSGDTEARARIAAKMLSEAKLGNIPVAAGAPNEKPAFAQGRWAEDFKSPALVPEKAVDLLKESIDREHGSMVVVAIGPLTNLAELLKLHPEEKKQIHEIVLMGGSIARGYTPGSGPAAEYNIAADAAAAQIVFASGIPIRMAPLDVTARLQLDDAHRQTIFAHHTPVTESLRALYVLWGEPTPTLHDPMAVSLLVDPALCQTKRLDIQIGSNGFTQPVSNGPRNAVVAVDTEPARFIDYYASLFAH